MPEPELQQGKYAENDGFQGLYRQLLDEGYTVFTRQDEPFETHFDQSRSDDQLVVISSGKVVFIAGETRYLLKDGDALVLPSGTVYTSSNEERLPACYFMCTKTAGAAASESSAESSGQAD